MANFKFNVNNATITDGEFAKSSELEDLLCENEGSFKLTDQFIDFLCDGFRIVVGFDLSVSGDYSSYDDDYWTPGYAECSIDHIDVKVTSVTVDEYEVDLNKSLIEIFTKLVKEKM